MAKNTNNDDSYINRLKKIHADFEELRYGLDRVFGSDMEYGDHYLYSIESDIGEVIDYLEEIKDIL